MFAGGCDSIPRQFKPRLTGSPSIHENRQEYRWVTPPTTPLAEWPPWLLARMKAESRKTEPAHTEPAAGTIAAGQRNTELTRLAGAMRRRGFDAVASRRPI